MNGKTYHRNVSLWPDGSVRYRHSLMALNSHSIHSDEVQALLASRPQYIVLGTGAAGKVTLKPEAEGVHRASGVQFTLETSPRAEETANGLAATGTSIAALLHIFCQKP